ncbi:Anhydro-N-acetylmuramic acid kinase [Lophiotrema nucula]|uniref:Anhydro-N-acetylmuramic acid kinase n=1 Tax=Lophiotrema nucula TaxID=690887 RepID=A0A6A5ZUQ8_9PLEO|nr:Anhydro-N-acetylmuramic acid kinase [Lophiotrema nucula]
MEAERGDRQDAPEPLKLRVLGVYSGKSLDTVDCALVEYNQDSPDTSLHLEVLQYGTVAIPSQIRATMLNVVHESRTLSSAGTQFMIQLGHVHSAATRSFCQKHDISLTSIDLIGSHSQAAELVEVPLEPGELPSRFGLGEGIVMASQTAITTITDFSIRVQSQSAGPQSDPLASRLDDLLLRNEAISRVCLNIGTMADITFIPPYTEDGDYEDFFWNRGLGTSVIDAAMRNLTRGQTQHDVNGVFGAQGTVNDAIVEQNLRKYQNSKFEDSHANANSTGDEEARDLIDQCMLLTMPDHDTIATITRIVAQIIVDQYKSFLKECVSSRPATHEIVLCGRGSQNPNIIAHLRTEIEVKPFVMLDSVGVPAGAKDAVSYAQLGLESMLGLEAHSSAAEHSIRENRIRGKVAPGPRWRYTMEHIAKFGQGKPLPTIDTLTVDARF